MPVSVTATEVARNFSGVMEKARAAGSVTVFKNSRPIAKIVPLDAVSEEQDATKLAEGFMDDYDDVFVELAREK